MYDFKLKRNYDNVSRLAATDEDEESEEVHLLVTQ